MVVLSAVFPAIQLVCPDAVEELTLTCANPSANRPRSTLGIAYRKKYTSAASTRGKAGFFPLLPFEQLLFLFFFFSFFLLLLRYQRRANDWVGGVRLDSGEGWGRGASSPLVASGRAVRVRAILQPLPLTFLYASAVQSSLLLFCLPLLDSPGSSPCSELPRAGSFLPLCFFNPLYSQLSVVVYSRGLRFDRDALLTDPAIHSSVRARFCF